MAESLVSHQPDVNEIYLYANYPNEAKYQFLNNKRENLGINHYNDSEAFTEYSNDIGDIYTNIEEYNPNKKRNPVVTELLIRGRKQNISLVFITQPYFAVPKIIRLNAIHYFIIKIPNK